MQPCTISCGDPSGDHGTCTGVIDVPVAGTVVVDLESPRPLRLRVGGIPVLEEDLLWRRYERRVRAIVLVPLAAGRHAVEITYGPRSGWPRHVDEHCPSRNRGRIRAGLRERIPDRFVLAARVAPGAAGPACSLRVTPMQCVEGGVTWQGVVARPIAGFRRLPPTLHNDRIGTLPAWALGLRSTVAPYEARDASGDAERADGVRLLLVPVANELEPLPRARAEGGVEERLEPEAVIVRRLPLEVVDATPPLRLSDWDAGLFPLPIDTAPRAVAAELPVHEARGRLAPAREHREIAWPDEAAVLAGATKPILPGSHARLLRGWEHAWRMLVRLRRRVDRRTGMPNDYVGTAMEGFFNQIFVWDSSFTTMALAWAHRVFPATANLDCLYSRQHDGGYIPRETTILDGTPSAFEPDFSPNPPLMTIAEWAIFAHSGDVLRLARVYPLLAANHRWLAQNRRLPDGTYWTTGLANGLDNSPSLGEGYPCLTAQMTHEAEILGLMAQALGRADEACAWETERRATAAALDARLWSEEMGFYSTSLAAGGHNPNKVATGFWPLWTGLVPPERVARLAERLLDPTQFWRHHPVPSLSADSPHFRPDGDYWLGSTWAPTNAATVWGFERAGRHDLAVRLAERHLAVLTDALEQDGCLWENYCSERTGKGSWSGRDYSWTAVGPIALLLEIVIGLRPDAARRTLRWVLPEGPGWGAQRIALGAATIDVRTAKEGTVVVSTDRPFRLELESGGCVRAIDLVAGDHRLRVEDVPVG